MTLRSLTEINAAGLEAGKFPHEHTDEHGTRWEFWSLSPIKAAPWYTNGREFVAITAEGVFVDGPTHPKDQSLAVAEEEATDETLEKMRSRRYVPEWTQLLFPSLDASQTYARRLDTRTPGAKKFEAACRKVARALDGTHETMTHEEALTLVGWDVERPKQHGVQKPRYYRNWRA